MDEKDWDVIGQKHIADLKKSSRAMVEDAAVRAVHKVMAEFNAQSDERLMDATAKDADSAYELLRRAENEMRYAGWAKFEMDNPARNGVYEQIKRFLK